MILFFYHSATYKIDGRVDSTTGMKFVPYCENLT